MALGLLAALAGLASACDISPPAATVDGVAISQNQLNSSLRSVLGSSLSAQVARCLVAGTTSVAGTGDDTVTAADRAAAAVDIDAGGASCTTGSAGPPVLSLVSPALRDELVGLVATDEAAIVRLARLDLSTSSLLGYYQTHQSQFTSECVSGILVATQAEAQQIHDAIVAGAPFATEAQAHSLDAQSAARGGQLGCYNDSDLQGNPQLIGLALELAKLGGVGKVSEPLEQPSATGVPQWVLIEISSRPVAPFDQVAGQIRSTLIQNAAPVLDQARTAALARARVTVDPRYGTWSRLRGLIPPAGVPERFLIDAAADVPSNSGSLLGGLGGPGGAGG